jgi:hypothetical protein
MSCPGNNWIVPGANPCVENDSGVTVVNAGTGITVTGTPTAPTVNNSFTVTAGTGITVTGTSTAPVINNDFIVIPGDRVTNTGTTTAPILNSDSQVKLVGTSATVQIDLQQNTITPILTLTFFTMESGFIIINGNATCRSIDNQEHDISYYCEIDGNMIQGTNFETVQGTNHYVTLSMTASDDLPAGNHTAIFFVSTTAGNNAVQVKARHLNGIITYPSPTFLLVTAPNETSPPLVPFTGNYIFTPIIIPSNYIYGREIILSLDALITTTVSGPPGVSFCTLWIYAIKDGDPFPTSPNFGSYIFDANVGQNIPLTFNNSISNTTYNRIIMRAWILTSQYGNVTCSLSNITTIFTVLGF